MEENKKAGTKTERETPEKVKAIDFSNADVSTRYEDVYAYLSPDYCETVRWQDNAYEFVCNNGLALRIQVVQPEIIRFRYAVEAHFERDFSYAVRPDLEPGRVKVKLTETDSEYQLASEKLQIVVSKKELKVRVFDNDDRLICEDFDAFSAKRTIMKGWSQMRVRKKQHRKESFLGLGDKAGPTLLNGRIFENWCTDAYAFGEDTDPMYRAIPFYYALHEDTAYGIFLDNTFRSHFDFSKSNVGFTEFRTDGGEMNYYFIYGPGLDDVARNYAKLTGTHALPPLWALGYHQCKWSYYPEERVHEIADTFRSLEIPCDAIYLDIDYMDGYRCFTWDKSHFPDPAKMIATLRDKGFQTVVMIDPGLKEDLKYPVYAEALKNNYLLKTWNGDVAKGPVWPGFCGFPDFTSPDVRAWWGQLYQGLYTEDGVSGFWNDMNEPAVFHVDHKTLPDHVRHEYDGDPCGHAKAHNIYGMQMARSSWEGLEILAPEKRPFLLTRATFCGGQRYAAVWTGDNLSTWEHLQIANQQCVRLSISGFSFCGSDIGGFSGDADGELFVRWLQLGVFHPLMRVHSMGSHASGDAAVTEEAELLAPEKHVSDQEPWSFGEKWTSLAKKAIELRYSILPCLYTAMWQLQQSGKPVLRPLAFADPLDPKVLENSRDFLFGEHILVSPVTQANVQRQMVHLPKGKWYYFWTGQAYSGELFVNLMPDQIPFFIREGAVVPIYPVQQWTNEKKIEELSLYVYYKNGTECSHLYEDAGEGMDYKSNRFSLQVFETKGTDSSLILNRTQTGDFDPGYEQVKVYLVGFPTFAHSCTVDGIEMPIKEIRLRDRSLYTMTVQSDFSTIAWKA
ncbi:MAG: glycoside hydrolase family 31 protein [Saprospiraceae bacterium]